MNFPLTEKSHLEIPLEENVNRITPDEGTVEARTIEDAIAVLRYNSFMICVTSCQYGHSDVDWNEVSQAYKSWPYLLIHFFSLLVSSTGPEDVDHHPERRMKAAFAAYEEANMPRLKKENPNMRLSQLKQQLKKEWMKSPENPLNQRFAAYNAKWMHCFTP